MADYKVTDASLTSIANAIRTKGGTSADLSYPDGFITAIGNISTGGTAAIGIEDTQDSHGGVVRTVTALDISDTTATAADVASGKYFYTSNGTKTAGTGAGGGVDCPVFTISADMSTEQFTSVTCNKTYAQALAYMDNYAVNFTDAAIADITGTYEGQTIYHGKDPMFLVSRENNTIKYYVYLGTGAIPYYQINYASTGTITWSNDPIPSRSSSDLTASNLTVTAPAGYYSSAATKTLSDQNFVASNIKKDVVIFGTTGTYEGGLDCPEFTITFQNGSVTSVTCNKTFSECLDYTTYGEFNAIFHSASTPELTGICCGGSDTALLYATHPYESGVCSILVTIHSDNSITWTQQTATSRSSSDLTASGATVTAPAGYYASNASKTIASGTEGTPTATKGTVSNNSVSVTPSVTNTAGYISGSTKTGTAVTVTASELVSGNKAITSAGTDIDVANYATASVSAGSATGPSSLSGSSATVTTGTNTITLTKTGVTTTPTVSAGYVASATASTATVALTASVTTKAAIIYHPSTSDQTIASGTYTTGTQTIKAVTVSGLSASSILSGTTVKIGDSTDDDCVTSVSGSVVIQHYYTGSGAPSSSTGENGDIYLKTS